MSAQTVLVNTKNGPVMGRRRVTGDQIEYVSYQGIPFAKPPLGELRFKVIIVFFTLRNHCVFASLVCDSLLSRGTF